MTRVITRLTLNHSSDFQVRLHELIILSKKQIRNFFCSAIVYVNKERKGHVKGWEEERTVVRL